VPDSAKLPVPGSWNWQLYLGKSAATRFALHCFELPSILAFGNFMQVRVLFFGMLKDIAGRAVDLISLPDHATLADVFACYENLIPRNVASSLAMSINQEFARPESMLKDGDEVAFLPPVSGGSSDSADEKSHHYASIVRKPIDTSTVLARIKQPADGAAVIFEGIVRDNTRGRQTLYLDYEAYEEMALKQMDELAQQGLAQFPIRDVAIVHRLGRLKIGEISVLIIVASAHRAAAFDACRWIIDTLKRTVPIWKKEYFEDGAVWADGDPFPSGISTLESSHSERPASK
jgi:molybdopterin synthase catalytic subunit/molybdopterin converting factor small subunit